MAAAGRVTDIFIKLYMLPFVKQPVLPMSNFVYQSFIILFIPLLFFFFQLLMKVLLKYLPEMKAVNREGDGLRKQAGTGD